MVNVSGKNLQHYESKGYLIPRRLDKRDRLRVAKGTIIEVKIEDLPKGSDFKVPKICDYCGVDCGLQHYYSIIYHREKGDGTDYCRECSGRKISNKRLDNVLFENSLAYVAPNLVCEWNSERNERIPEQVSSGSDIKYWWICPDCQSDYELSPFQRVYNKQDCVYCSNSQVNHTNCLATTHPHLFEEWHPIKNKSLTPFNITYGSGKRVWWLCPDCESDYDMTIGSKLKCGCPYCSGRRVNHTNCLATTHPELTKEWHITFNEISPHQVTSGSHKKAWWICSNENCDNVWEAEVKSRAIAGNGCSVCNESKGEKAVRLFLEKNSINFIPQFSFDDLLGIGGGLLRFDFAIFNTKNKLKLLIEYDGEFHFKKQFEDDGHEIIVRHDKIKNTYCTLKNIPLLRIPYWNFHKIEEILNKEIKITEG